MLTDLLSINIKRFKLRRKSSKLYSSSTSFNKKIGILSESKNRWECRVPLTPENIKNLKHKWKDALEFYVQPSKNRIFSDEQYIKVNDHLFFKSI